MLQLITYIKDLNSLLLFLYVILYRKATLRWKRDAIKFIFTKRSLKLKHTNTEIYVMKTVTTVWIWMKQFWELVWCISKLICPLSFLENRLIFCIFSLDLIKFDFEAYSFTWTRETYIVIYFISWPSFSLISRISSIKFLCYTAKRNVCNCIYKSRSFQIFSLNLVFFYFSDVFTYKTNVRNNYVFFNYNIHLTHWEKLIMYVSEWIWYRYPYKSEICTRILNLYIFKRYLLIRYFNTTPIEISHKYLIFLHFLIFICNKNVSKRFLRFILECIHWVFHFNWKSNMFLKKGRFFAFHINII